MAESSNIESKKKCKNNVEKSRCNKNRVKIKGSEFLQNPDFTKMVKYKKSVPHVCNCSKILGRCFLSVREMFSNNISCISYP